MNNDTVPEISSTPGESKLSPESLPQLNSVETKGETGVDIPDDKSKNSPAGAGQNEIATKDWQTEELMAAIEALLFASGEPVSEKELLQVLKVSPEQYQSGIEGLSKTFSSKGRGICLLISGKANSVQIRTKDQYAAYIQELKSDKPRKLSPAALETLAIVAYRQPVIKSEIEQIRGVDVTPTLKTLIDRKLLKIAGVQNTAGQPAVYVTTEAFLQVFGLSDLQSLPELKELKEIMSDPGEQE